MNFLIIAELLGFDDYIPSYATTRSQDILKGVNYASGAAGIRSESGQQMVTYYPNLLRQTLYKTRDEDVINKCFVHDNIHIFFYICHRVLALAWASSYKVTLLQSHALLIYSETRT